MSGLVQRVRAKVDSRCIATRIHKEGCSVSLDGAPTIRLIVDLDEPSSPLPPPNQRCDYLFLADAADGDDWLAPLELKRGQFDASEAVVQLRAGTRAADQLVPRNLAVRFRPVAVFGGGNNQGGTAQVAAETEPGEVSRFCSVTSTDEVRREVSR